MKTHAFRVSQNGLRCEENSSTFMTGIHFLSMASAAENFRSTCGPERGPPECSTQASPAAAAQVGQGTTEICSEVSSFFFIRTACENIGRETVQFCTLFVSAAAYRRPLGSTEAQIPHRPQKLALRRRAVLFCTDSQAPLLVQLTWNLSRATSCEFRLKSQMKFNPQNARHSGAVED